MTEPRSHTPSASAPSAEQRDAAVTRLTQAFAEGRLELEDLEQRLDIAARCTSVADLKLTLTGLGTSTALPALSAEPDVPVPAPSFRTDRPRASPRTIVVMSGTHRRGRWVPAPVHRVYALMGGAKLDLRDAELRPGVTEIRLNVLMGGVRVIVSPDLDLEVDGWVFMGGIEKRDLHPAPLETQLRRVRIRARIVLGRLDVKVRERTGA
jgi:hypothetical protein